MDTRTVFGLLVALSVCLVGVYAQGYWTSGEDEVTEVDSVYPSMYQLLPVGSSEDGRAALVVSPHGLGTDYWIEKARAGGGGGRGKGKGKKKKKKKKGKKKKAGWGPFSITTHGVRVGWKGWIPPVHGKGWGWYKGKKGHFKFVDYGPAWGKPQRPHFPEPGPPVLIKHHPVHVQQQGWGW